LTFDDGLADHYTAVFPALKQRGLSGVFFLVGAALSAPAPVLNVHKAHFLLARLGPDRFAEEVRGAILDLSQPGRIGPAVSSERELYRYDRPDAQGMKRLLNYDLPIADADRVLGDLFRRHVGDEAAFARALYLAPEMTAEMAAEGMTFGFHTESHVALSRLSRQQQRAEVERGVSVIGRLTGQQRVPFCYPYGHAQTYDRASMAVVEEAGYSAAFSVVRAMVRFGKEHRYDLPRFDTRDLPPFSKELSVA
ncbi:MAG: polysaccharide deacetylase family protein, partial [Dehalococcoidia bacterium]